MFKYNPNSSHYEIAMNVQHLLIISAFEPSKAAPHEFIGFICFTWA